VGYQITIKANAGTVTATVEGDLPDGEHVITGHDDGDLASLYAVRRNELGRYVVSAQHAHSRAELAQGLTRVAAVPVTEADDDSGS
jgi:hypothetical protein